MVEVTENTGIVSFDKDWTQEAAGKTSVYYMYAEWITFDIYNAIYTSGNGYEVLWSLPKLKRSWSFIFLCTNEW